MNNKKVYVAGHSQAEANAVANKLKDAGFEITSTWLDEKFLPTSEYTPEIRKGIAERDIAEVTASDFLILISSPTRVPGGKFVEAGVALGQGKRVVCLGCRENMLLWSEKVDCFCTVEDFIKSL